MQINYHLTTQNLSKWKHQSLVLSVNFVVTEYAPGGGFTVGKQINHKLQNGSIIDFDKLIPLVSGLNVLNLLPRCFYTKVYIAKLLKTRLHCGLSDVNFF